MSAWKEIKILRRADGLFLVHVDDRWADELSHDEALGVVASALFAGFKGPIFVATAEENEKRAAKYGMLPEEKPDGEA